MLGVQCLQAEVIAAAHVEQVAEEGEGAGAEHALSGGGGRGLAERSASDIA
jgi:hypothetical protein